MKFDDGRRKFFQLAAAGAVLAAPGLLMASEPKPATPMDAFTALKTRRSVRAYTDKPVSDEELDAILEAAMLAPSAANEQPWDFVVIKDKKSLDAVGGINPYAAYAKKAPLAILLCLNEKKEKEKGMGILDVGMAAENMLLAAHALGLGAVFAGIYPVKERMVGFRKLTGLPDYVQPIGLVVIGHPEIPGLREAPDRFKKDAIHMEKWQG